MQTRQTHTTYGLITALILIVISAGSIVTKMALAHPFLIGLASIIIFLVGIILNGQAFSKANGADITFGQAFASCFKAALIVTVLLTVWAFASNYIFPNMETEAMEHARRQLEAGGMSEEMIDKSMGMAKTFSSPAIKIFGSLLVYAAISAVWALIGGAVAKKNPAPAQMM